MSATAGGGFETHKSLPMDQFEQLWSQALSDYTKKTKIDLSKHPLAKDLAMLTSPEAICDVFQEKMKRYRKEDTKWGRIRNDYVKPIVNALLIVNETLGETAGNFSVIPGGKVLFVAFGAVLLATKGVSERYDALLDLLDEIKIFFESLRLRTTSPASWRNKLSRNIASLILAHILDAFALATSFISSTNRSCARLLHLGHSLTGTKDMQEALKRLRLLTTLESQAISSETRVDVAECRGIAAQLRQELGKMKTVQALDSLSLKIVERSVGDVLSKLVIVANELHEAALSIEEKAEARDLLGRLDRVGFADLISQRRSGCLPGTRVAVLDTLFSWSNDADAPRIYWLNGMAGTGKSAIARSFAQRLRDNGTLGGSYFCSRESHPELADANRIVPTLAAALAGFDVQYKVALLSVLKRYSSDAHPSTWVIKLQVKRLFFEPYSCYMREVSTSPMPILVIDALDEASDDTVGDLLDSLTSVSRRLPIKFFLTSRPERHIRWRLDSFQYGNHLRLHDVEETIVTADIRLYIKHRLNAIVDRFRGRAAFPEDWPTRQDTESLVSLSGSLFIYAFTTTEHIGDRNPVKRMQDVLNVRRRLWTAANPLNDLDRIYTFILNAATADRTLEELLLTKRTLAAILAARELLSLRTLARLLGSAVDEIRDALDELHAVVNVPEDADHGSVSTLHASFGDFLTDRERVQGLMHVNLVNGHRDLAIGCLDVALSDDLHFNMSRARTSFLSNEEQGITVTFGHDVQYVCKQWVHHSRSVTRPSAAFLNQVAAFLSTKFLFWLEGLSALDVDLEVISESSKSYDDWELPQGTSFPKVMVQEACDILDMMGGAIRCSAPHVYLSLLPFMFLFPNMEKAHRASFALTASPHFQWLDENIGDEGYRLVACSHDKRSIAAVSGDCNIDVWSLPDGEPQRRPDTSHGSPGRFVTITFSPDSTSIWAASRDGTVWIWERATGRYLTRWEGKATTPLAMAFSSDGRYLAIASKPLEGYPNWCIHLWELPISGDTSVHLKAKLQLTPEDIDRSSDEPAFRMLEFSPSSSYIVVGTSVLALYGWDVETGELCLQRWPDSLGLKDHSINITALNFLSDHEILFGSQWDGELRVLDMNAGQPSSHPELVVSGYEPETKFVPGTTTSYKGPDGTFMATALVSGIHLWSMGTGVSTRPDLEGHVGPFDFISISRDGSYIISGAGSGNTDGLLDDNVLDYSIIVWDIDPSSDRCRSAMNNDFDHFYLPDHNSGLLQGPKRELLLYIPKKFRQYLQHPPIIHRFAAGRLTIDWTDAVYGEDWTKCYMGPR
ncbi:unnamed protein product [Peniophora sp. CBMAI 1063]|nr:unnamed protein product [Peniophora sp. CBMAI 1063]